MVLNKEMTSKYGVTYQPDEIIFLEYEPGDSFYLIQSGRVKITKIAKDTEKILDILGPGDIFGEMAILENAPRSASAIAAEEVKLLLFRKENFEIILQSNPAMALRLLKIFAKRIFDQKRRMTVYAHDEDNARVLAILLMLVEKQGYDPNSSGSAELKVTNEQIASWTGIKAENCRKALEHFDRIDRIVFKKDKIIIRNVSEIQRMSGAKRKQQ